MKSCSSSDVSSLNCRLDRAHSCPRLKNNRTVKELTLYILCLQSQDRLPSLCGWRMRGQGDAYVIDQGEAYQSREFLRKTQVQIQRFLLCDGSSLPKKVMVCMTAD